MSTPGTSQTCHNPHAVKRYICPPLVKPCHTAITWLCNSHTECETKSFWASPPPPPPGGEGVGRWSQNSIGVFFRSYLNMMSKLKSLCHILFAKTCVKGHADSLTHSLTHHLFSGISLNLRFRNYKALIWASMRGLEIFAWCIAFIL